MGGPGAHAETDPEGWRADLSTHAIADPGRSARMLFRRLMQHVNSQNWFAVGVDFLIVVVGVFVGLEAQHWSEANKDRLTEAHYRADLLSDLQEDQRELADVKASAVAQVT